jgi:hypothetical protein
MNDDWDCPICGQVVKQGYPLPIPPFGCCSPECARVAAIVGAIDRLTTALTPVITVTVSEDGLEARVKWADGTEDCYRKGAMPTGCPRCGEALDCRNIRCLNYQPAPPTSA